jgi:hypothetical protein
MTKASLTEMQAMVSTPLALSSLDLLTKSDREVLLGAGGGDGAKDGKEDGLLVLGEVGDGCGLKLADRVEKTVLLVLEFLVLCWISG